MTDAASSDAEPATEAEAEEQPPFENRAARRAKGKAAPNHTAGGKGGVQGRSGTVQSPRQYGTRRSG
jgi:hypothetical protein